MSTKRILSLVLALVMVLGTFGSLVFADEATNNEKVNALIEDGLVQGYEDGTYGLDKPITRAEVATMIVRALGAETEANGMLGIPSRFSDMGEALWANGNVNYAVGKAIVNGYPDGTFKPKANVTYNEVAKMLVMAFELVKVEDVNKVDWPLGWLTKAAENGILEGVTGVNFNDAAVRENVFEMIYNAYYNMEVGYNTKVKAIVLENDRIAKMKNNEVVVEVIRELQRSQYADASRYEKGDQDKYTIELKGHNVEEMLGKVYDFTIDRSGKVVRAELDTTYEYLQGSVSGYTLTRFNGHIVNLGEKYDERDERVFRTYHNDKDFEYREFVRDIAGVDYARYTVKNGKVLFVDAYSFEDIAPVQENRTNGVYVYNDFRDARVEKFDLGALVVGYNNGLFSRIAVADIEPNDVVHVYNNGRSAIVRLDAMVEGEYIKVERRNSDNNYYAHVGEGSYKINERDYRKPVFAHDSKAFETLHASQAQKELAKFYKEEVTILLDIKNDLQLFGAEVEYNEGVTVVDQILAKGRGRFVKADNERAIFDETWDSEISFVNIDGNWTTNRRLTEFDRGDLTFTQGSEGDLEQLVRLAEYGFMRNHNNNQGLNEANIGSGYISTDAMRYQVLARTNVFVIDEKDGVVVDITGTTMADVKRQAVVNSDMRAFVLSDEYVYGLNERLISNRHRITNRPDIAHTIVIMELNRKGAAYDSETAHISNVYTATRPHHLVGYGPDNHGGKKLEREAVVGGNLTGLRVDDIVSLKLTKADEPKVATWSMLIPGNLVDTKSYRVVDINSKGEYRILTLKDALENPVEKWLIPGYEEYGTVTIDSVVTFHEANTFGDIDVIRVYPANTRVTANGSNVELPEKAEKFGGFYNLRGVEYVTLNGVAYPYVGDEVDVNTEYVVPTYQVINGEKTVIKLTLVEIEEPVDPEEPEEPEEPVDPEEKAVANVTYQTMSFGPATLIDVTVNSVEGKEVTKVELVGFQEGEVGKKLSGLINGDTATLKLYNGEELVATLELEVPVASKTTVDLEF